MNHLGVDNLCVLTTNKALAELAAEIQNGAGHTHIGTVEVVAAQGSWALKNVGAERRYAIVNWKTLKIVGWEHPGLSPIHTNWLSGPWLGDLP